MGAGQCSEVISAETISALLERFDLRRFHHVGSELVGEDVLVADLGPIVLRRCSDFVEAVFDPDRERDRAVAGQRPRCRRPDDDELSARRSARASIAAAPQRGAIAGTHRKLHPDHVRLIVLVLDLGLGQRGLLDHATTSPASSRDRAGRSRRTSSARARSAPRPETSWSNRDCSNRPRRRAA